MDAGVGQVRCVCRQQVRVMDGRLAQHELTEPFGGGQCAMSGANARMLAGILAWIEAPRSPGRRGWSRP